MKEEEFDGLEFAPLITDEESAAAAAPEIDPADDPDHNKEAEEDDHVDGFGEEDP